MARSAPAASSLLALGLAACGGADQPQAKSNPAEPASAFQQRLQAMPEGARNGVFIRAIRDSHQECQHVDVSVPTRSSDGAPVWVAHCTGGGVFAIAIRDGGIAQVIPDRGDLVLTGRDNNNPNGNSQ
jgi:hypothetical protein